MILVEKEPKPGAAKSEAFRNVAMLCCSFARNMAYYRAGWMEGRFLNPDPNHNFWLQVNGNFFDICVLAWCQLFGNPKNEKHHWKNVASKPETFKVELLRCLGLDEIAFINQIKIMLTY